LKSGLAGAPNQFAIPQGRARAISITGSSIITAVPKTSSQTGGGPTHQRQGTFNSTSLNNLISMNNSIQPSMTKGVINQTKVLVFSIFRFDLFFNQAVGSLAARKIGSSPIRENKYFPVPDKRDTGFNDDSSCTFI
jgi:hypothetical protein